MSSKPTASRLERWPPMLAVSAVLLAVVFVLRLSVTTPGFGITLLYDIPVALVAVAYGFRAGIVAATVALGVFALGESLAPIHTSTGVTVGVNAIGYVSRALVFYLLGGLLGLYSDRLRKNFAERQEAEAQILAKDKRLASVEALARIREEERRRWARELHDQTLQGLVATQILLNVAMDSDEPKRSQSVNRALAGLEEEVDNLRLLRADLRPRALEELGLTESLRSLGRVVRDRDGMDVEIKVDLSGPAGGKVDDDVETTVYRIVQEALTNASKHSGAEHVVVDVTATNGSIEVGVADDGHGFTASERGDGLGLTGIEERATLLGGSARVDSTPGEGTRVKATIPVAAAGK
jgi:signal transduction histidine kinase